MSKVCPFFVCSGLEDPVTCSKDFELCLGTCAGKTGTQLNHDFNSMVSFSELNPDVIGQDVFDGARADCNTRQTTISVDLFEGGVYTLQPFTLSVLTNKNTVVALLQATPSRHLQFACKFVQG